MRRVSAALLALVFLVPIAAQAGWKEMSAGVTVSVVRDGMTVTPQNEWNRWSSRPSERGEIWTIDGVAINELSFFTGIKDGETLYREQYTSLNPLPKFRSSMLPTDLVEFFEGSNRIVLQSSLFKIDSIEPAKLGEHDAVRFRYHYVSQSDEIARLGEGVAANIDGKLYLVNFVAPAIHYFDRDIAAVRTIVDSVNF